MRNIKLTLEYLGTNYVGWQAQPEGHGPSIQQELERALSTLLKEDIKTVAAGRTDAGVHATGQVANFKTNSDVTLDKLRWSGNGLLPNDIVIKEAEEVPEDFDARRSAQWREYDYHILNRSYPSPFHSQVTHYVARPLTISAMNEASGYLVGRHDFSSFCVATSAKEQASTVREILFLRCLKEEDLVKVRVRAESFLHNMVRIIAGTLIRVGLGEVSPGEVKKILRAEDRKKAGPTAPAQGLFLTRVYYSLPASK